MPSRPSTPAEHANESSGEDADRKSKRQDPEQAGLSTPAAVPPVEEGVKEEKIVDGLVRISPSAEEEVFVDAESGSDSEKEGAKAEKEGRDKVRLSQDDNELEEKEKKVEEKLDNAEEKSYKDGEKAENKDEEMTNKIEVTTEKTDLKDNVEEKAETKTDEKITEKAETSVTKVEGDDTVVTSLDVQTNDGKDAEKDSNNSKKSSDDDSSGNYVGDTTWEERTWKEIIRLKEAMFWARIGGLKQ